MAKFRFRLATLLRLRESARDERRAELAQAYRADEILRHRRARLARELSDLETRTRSCSAPGELDLDRLLETRRYELVLRSQEERLRGQRQALEAEIERRRQALIDASRQVRVLEQLRQKQHERHRREEIRQEVRQTDEAASRCTRQEDV
jgi:flagellar export protein FliJ